MTTFVSFDIDGTLIPLGGGCPGLFKRALLELFGSAAEEIISKSPRKFIDIPTCEKIMIRAGIQSNQKAFDDLQRKCEEIFLKETEKHHSASLRGVENALQFLSSKNNVVIGIASNNYESIGWSKIEQANLARFFPDKIGGFGLIDKKSELIQMALNKAKQLKNIEKFDKCFHVGDTLKDAQSALEIGFTPIVVKTGNETDFPKNYHVFNQLDDPGFLNIFRDI